MVRISFSIIHWNARIQLLLYTVCKVTQQFAWETDRLLILLCCWFSSTSKRSDFEQQQCLCVFVRVLTKSCQFVTISELLYITLRLIGWTVGLISVLLTGLFVGVFHLLASARTPPTVEAYILYSCGIVSMNPINHRPKFLNREPNGDHTLRLEIFCCPPLLKTSHVAEILSLNLLLSGTEMVLQLKHQSFLIIASAH